MRALNGIIHLCGHGGRGLATLRQNMKNDPLMMQCLARREIGLWG